MQFHRMVDTSHTHTKHCSHSTLFVSYFQEADESIRYGIDTMHGVHWCQLYAHPKWFTIGRTNLWMKKIEQSTSFLCWSSLVFLFLFIFPFDFQPSSSTRWQNVKNERPLIYSVFVVTAAEEKVYACACVWCIDFYFVELLLIFGFISPNVNCFLNTHTHVLIVIHLTSNRWQHCHPIHPHGCR